MDAPTAAVVSVNGKLLRSDASIRAEGIRSARFVFVLLGRMGRSVEHMVCGLLCSVSMICLRAVAGKMGLEERQAQKSYWEEHSKNLTVEAMMLDSHAVDLDKEERPEVIVSAMMFSPIIHSIVCY